MFQRGGMDSHALLHYSKNIEEENKELVGSVQNAVVVEVGSKGGFIAKTDSYIPVIVDGVNLGDFIKVKITDATATYLKGDVVSK